MAEPLPQKSGRCLHVLESSGLIEYGPTLEITLGRCLRLLPGRREVYFADTGPLGAGQFIAKRYLPHAKQERDARREWQGLRFLHENELPGPQPYFLADDEADGSLWVLMEKIEALEALDQIIARQILGSIDRRAMVRQMVDVVRKMHGCGARQADQHAGNWGWDGEKLYLLDAGTICIARHGLAEGERLKDFAHLCVTLPPSMEQDFREKLRESSLSNWQRDENRLDRALMRVQRARLRRYDMKTRRSCTEFQRDERDGVLCLLDRRADKDLREVFRHDPEALMAGGTSLKAGNTCTVVTINFGGKRYVLKRYNKKTLLQRLRTRGKRSRAMRSWSSSWLLKMAFIATARVVGVREEYTKGLRRYCYLLMEALEGELLDTYVAAHRDNPEKLALVASQFARIWSALERMRAAHGDFKATNFIVDASGELYLIDLDVFIFNLPKWLYQRRRDKDWRRFMKNWASMPEVARIFEVAVQKERAKDSE